MEMRLCGEKKPPTFKRDRITIEVSGNVTSGPISNYRSLSVVSSNNWVNKHIGFDICNLNGFWSWRNCGNILGMDTCSFSHLVVFCENECLTTSQASKLQQFKTTIHRVSDPTGYGIDPAL